MQWIDGKIILRRAGVTKYCIQYLPTICELLHFLFGGTFCLEGSMIEVQCVVFCPPTGSSELIGMNIHCKSTWQNLKMYSFTIWIAYIAKMSIIYMFYYYAKLSLVYQKVRLWKQRLKLNHCCPLIKLPTSNFHTCQGALLQSNKEAGVEAPWFDHFRGRLLNMHPRGVNQTKSRDIWMV